MTAKKEAEPVSDSEGRNTKSLADRARSVISNVGQDDRVKQAAAVTKDVATRAGQASRSVSRKVSQEDAWDELRGDIAMLTEIARADHALMVDLIERVAVLETQGGIAQRPSHGG